MYCERCRGWMGESPKCGYCEALESRGGRASSPTLIQGVHGFAAPGRVRARRGPDQRYAVLGSLLWSVLVLLAVPWMLGEKTTPSERVATRIESRPALTVESEQRAPIATSTESMSSDRIDLTIRIPANRWVDTGISICGCTNLKITTSSAWVDGFGRVEPQSSYTPAITEDAKERERNRLAFERRDALTRRAEFGALVAKVGSGPLVDVIPCQGVSREINGSRFNDVGTLKLGMNAGRVKAGSGVLVVNITGTGEREHEVRYCAVPK